MKYNLKLIKNLKLNNISKRRKIIIIIVLSIFLIFSISSFIFGENEDQKAKEIRKIRQDKLDAIIGNKQTIDCIRCHTTGQPSFVAKDTINKLSSCYNCHREDIDFLAETSSKIVHIYHEGNLSVLPGYPNEVDYSTRHKDILGSCTTCHVYQIGKTPPCIVCHSGKHIEEKKSMVCADCHGQLSDLFRHKTVELQTHNIFGNNSCRMCHSSDKIALELANGNRVTMVQSSALCKQCHYGIYKQWANGDHISVVGCVICHNPHSPKNINQTILNIAKEITAEKKVETTPSKANSEKNVPVVIRRSYDYEKIQE